MAMLERPCRAPQSWQVCDVVSWGVDGEQMIKGQICATVSQRSVKGTPVCLCDLMRSSSTGSAWSWVWGTRPCSGCNHKLMKHLVKLQGN